MRHYLFLDKSDWLLGSTISVSLVLHLVLFWCLPVASRSRPVVVTDLVFQVEEPPQVIVPVHPAGYGSDPLPKPDGAMASHQDPVSSVPDPPRPVRQKTRPKIRREKPLADTPRMASSPTPSQQIDAHPQDTDAIASWGEGSVPGTGKSPLAMASGPAAGPGTAAHGDLVGEGGGGSGLALQEAIPLYKSNPPPEYPAVARRRGYQGTVILEVLVNVDGAVADLRLAHSSGFPVLDQTALSSVKAWLFVPAKKGQNPVESWVKIPVCFRLTDGGTP